MSVDDPRLSRALAIAAENPAALLAVVGPTASGKTELAIALAERLDGEIVSADSVQIYTEFDLGSGKPSAEELGRVPHHLIGAISPLEMVDAARFSDMAANAIRAIRARGKRPIVCGGTFLWTKALIWGLAGAPAASDAIRERHRTIEAEQGRAELHARLHAIDPTSAARLHPNDFVRVSRALEVHELSGRPLSAWHAEHRFSEHRYDARLIGIATTPEELTTRIEARVDRWLASGWIDEVRGLIERGYGGARAMQSVGYDEVHLYLRGELSRDDLGPTIVRATRVFARRQRTWLKSHDVAWL